MHGEAAPQSYRQLIGLITCEAVNAKMWEYVREYVRADTITVSDCRSTFRARSRRSDRREFQVVRRADSDPTFVERWRVTLVQRHELQNRTADNLETVVRCSALWWKGKRPSLERHLERGVLRWLVVLAEDFHSADCARPVANAGAAQGWLG